MIKIIAIFSILLVGGLSICPRHKENADSNRKHINNVRPMRNNNNNIIIENKKIDNPGDPNPSLIPSLADPSNAIGLLKPLDIDLADQCFPKPQCDPNAKFRTIDGSCNNLLFPIYGQSNTAHTRIIEANYSDGINQPRKAVSGQELPNVRHIRKMIFKDMDVPTSEHNLLLLHVGELIAVDTEFFGDKTQSDGSELICCNPDGSTPDILPEGCLWISIPPEESVISKNRCFSIPRASDTLDIGCKITPVRQQNTVTSFIDASVLYGSDVNTANLQRSFINGKFKRIVESNGGSYFRSTPIDRKFCLNNNTGCYDSGDIRINLHPNLAVQTISLLRLHNNLCDELERINPTWNDEKLYQEARRLLIGMYQHAIYNEFVPLIIGSDFSRKNNLLPLTSGFNNNYDQFLNPTTFTSFTAVAYRSFHSYIQGFIDLFSEMRNITSRIRLSDAYFQPLIIQKNNNYDSFFRGLLTQHAQEQDEFFTEEVSECLFKIPNKTMGIDLISIDLIRGRDFGEPSYNSFRQLCGLSVAQTFDDLSDQIDKKHIDILTTLYDDVNDIDFFVGGIFEKLKPGAKAGHTFQCIIGEMFFRWKFGDRFFYEFGNQPGSFSLEQLNEIRKTTFALIACMATDILNVQREALKVPSDENPLVSCKSIPKLNLTPWKNV